MVDICAMILNKISRLFLASSILILFNSCGTLEEYIGLTDEDAEKDLINSTPELVLPPDFGKLQPEVEFLIRKKIFLSNRKCLYFEFRICSTQSFKLYRTTILCSSSKTPFDSLEKFKQNKRFTIGMGLWTICPRIQGRKYIYKPVYDKGYNFSRRYLPNQNIDSFRSPMQQPYRSYSPPSNVRELSNKQQPI